MQQKHFLDIQNARFIDDEYRQNNIEGFNVGDLIFIQEKVDGSNASITYDAENEKLACFSSRKELTYDNTLNGFYNYVNNLEKDIIEVFKKYSNMVFFGEWNLNKNKIKTYEKEFTNLWIVYDIYDKNTSSWMPQDFVRKFCKENKFSYINVLYEGEFISWEHCKSFLHKNTYGKMQEGIVVKNMSKINSISDRFPFYVKIVNEEFKEKMKFVPKEYDAEVEQNKKKASEIVEQIVTKRRVEKGIEKLRDEGILPEKIRPEDMKIVAKNLPKYIYDDCIKEEKEMVIAAGEYFSKMCNSKVMQIAKDLIL